MTTAASSQSCSFTQNFSPKLETLPQEVLEEVYTYLSPRDVRVLSSTCSDLKHSAVEMFRHQAVVGSLKLHRILTTWGLTPEHRPQSSWPRDAIVPKLAKFTFPYDQELVARFPTYPAAYFDQLFASCLFPLSEKNLVELTQHLNAMALPKGFESLPQFIDYYRIAQHASSGSEEAPQRLSNLISNGLYQTAIEVGYVHLYLGKRRAWNKEIVRNLQNRINTSLVKQNPSLLFEIEHIFRASLSFDPLKQRHLWQKLIYPHFNTCGTVLGQRPSDALWQIAQKIFSSAENVKHSDAFVSELTDYFLNCGALEQAHYCLKHHLEYPREGYGHGRQTTLAAKLFKAYLTDFNREGAETLLRENPENYQFKKKLLRFYLENKCYSAALSHLFRLSEWQYYAQGERVLRALSQDKLFDDILNLLSSSGN